MSTPTTLYDKLWNSHLVKELDNGTSLIYIDLHFLQIKNVLALRGDARKFDDKFIPEKNGHEYALDLVRQITALNKGEYLDKDIVRNGWDNVIKQIFLPVEKVYKVQNGKKVMREIGRAHV